LLPTVAVAETSVRALKLPLRLVKYLSLTRKALPSAELENNMHPQELVNRLLIAAQTAQQDGFPGTAKAFVALAAAIRNAPSDVASEIPGQTLPQAADDEFTIY
jgi:hypothetical protein